MKAFPPLLFILKVNISHCFKSWSNAQSGSLLCCRRFPNLPLSVFLWDPNIRSTARLLLRNRWGKAEFWRTSNVAHAANLYNYNRCLRDSGGRSGSWRIGLEHLFWVDPTVTNSLRACSGGSILASIGTLGSQPFVQLCHRRPNRTEILNLRLRSVKLALWTQRLC